MNDRLFLFLLAVLPLASTWGQNAALASLLDCVERQYGADNLLVNGRVYTPSHPKAEGHPYFQTEEWMAGTVYINGNAFSVNQLKYSLFEHQLILKHERPNGTTQRVVLSDLLVDSFQIDQHLFVSKRLISSEKENSGYLEEIFTNKLSFFRFQQKVLSPISNFRPYGQFSPLKDVFFLILNGQVHKITQQKEFLTYFPKHKTAIKKYLKDHDLRWKKMTKTQFIQLLNFCDGQI